MPCRDPFLQMSAWMLDADRLNALSQTCGQAVLNVSDVLQLSGWYRSQSISFASARTDLEFLVHISLQLLLTQGEDLQADGWMISHFASSEEDEAANGRVDQSFYTPFTDKCDKIELTWFLWCLRLIITAPFFRIHVGEVSLPSFICAQCKSTWANLNVQMYIYARIIYKNTSENFQIMFYWKLEWYSSGCWTCTITKENISTETRWRWEKSKQ